MKTAWRTTVVACVLSSLAGCGPSAEEKLVEAAKKEVQEIAERVQLRESFGEDNPPVISLAFDTDGKVLASGHKDGTIRLWDVATGKVIKTLEGHADIVTSVIFWPDGKTLGSGSLDRTIKIWNVGTGKENATLEGHSGGVSSIALNTEGKTLASGSLDRTIKVWDVVTNKEIKTLEGHSVGVTSVAFRPNGKTLASGSADWESEIKLWDVESGEVSSTLVWPNKNAGPHLEGVACLVFSPDGKSLVLGAKNMWIIQWDVDSGKIIGGTPAQSARVDSIAFNPNGKTLASCCDDEKITLWDMADVGKRKPGSGGIPSLECLWPLPLTGNFGAAAIAFSPDGKTLASGKGGWGPGKITFWDVKP